MDGGRERRMAKDLQSPTTRSSSLESSSLWCHAIIFLFALLSFMPKAMFYLEGLDSRSHLSWNIGFGEALRAGALYPRWLRDVNQGDGDPLFVFYGPVFSYLTSLFSWKLNILTSVKLAAFVFWWGAGAAMFVCARQWLGRRASLLAALAYLLMPHHLYDLYGRAALAELGQFIWAPLIVRRVARLADAGSRNVILLAACLAGALLTHLVTALILFYFLAAAGVVLLFRARPAAWKLLAAALGSLGLSAVYLLPAVLERRFINPFFLETRWNYRTYLPWGSMHHWSWGLDVGLGLLLGVQGYAVLRMARGSEASERFRRIECWLLIASGVALFMTLPLSAPAWHLPGVAYVMFPVRWLLISCLAAALVAGFQFERRNLPGGTWRAAVVLAFAANLFLSGAHWKDRAEMALHSGPDWKQAGPAIEEARYKTEFTTPPVWVPNPKQRFKMPLNPSASGPDAELLQGSGTARATEWAPNFRQVELALETPALVELRTFYFPGWGCTLDSAAIPLQISAKGRLQIAAQAGAHLLSCRFSNTSDRTAGAIISLLSALAAAIIFARSSRDT